jgi:hypothetical protein
MNESAIAIEPNRVIEASSLDAPIGDPMASQ